MTTNASNIYSAKRTIMSLVDRSTLAVFIWILLPTFMIAQTFGSGALLSGDFVEVKNKKSNPIEFLVTFDGDVQNLTEFAFVFAFGDDLLDPGECLFIEIDSVGGGGGFCNIGPTSQSTGTLTVPCSVSPDECAALSGGAASGRISAETMRLTGKGAPN